MVHGCSEALVYLSNYIFKYLSVYMKLYEAKKNEKKKKISIKISFLDNISIYEHFNAIIFKVQ